MYRKSKKHPPSSLDVAPVGDFCPPKTGSKKLERTFYFLAFGRKMEDFREITTFLVEKKSLLFRSDFRILKSIGGDKWVNKAEKWYETPPSPKKRGKGAA